jgi:hypothetical protein
LTPVDITALYRGPLEDFVARRNALVQQLRSSDAEAAGAVAKLRKPPVSAWAIDQLAAEELNLITQLLAAGADAGEAQVAAAGGSGSSTDLLAASTRVRDRVEAAVRAATTVLDRAGHATSEETIRRIRTTLQAAAAGHPADRVALWRGTLDRDLEPTGFGAPDSIEDDVPELLAALAPLRRPSSPSAGHATPDRPRAARDLAALRGADRAAAEYAKTAARAREMAATRRQHADRLAVEARRAAEEAEAAEASADHAEDAARVAHEALESLRGDNR